MKGTVKKMSEENKNKGLGESSERPFDEKRSAADAQDQDILNSMIEAEHNEDAAGISDADYSDLLSEILAQDAVDVAPEVPGKAADTADHGENKKDEAEDPDETKPGDAAAEKSSELFKKIKALRKAHTGEKADDSEKNDKAEEAAEPVSDGNSEGNVDVGANTDVFEDYEYVSNSGKKSDDAGEEVSAEDDTDVDETSAAGTADDSGNTDDDSDGDSDLMVALGYADGDDSGKERGARNEKELKRRIGDIGSDYNGAFGYRGEEYRRREQSADIRKAYRSDSLSMIIRAAGTAIFTLVILIYEFFGKKFGGAISAADYPTVHILVSMQLLLLAAAFSWRQIARGLMGIFRFELTAHSAAAAAVTVVLIYDAVLAIAAPDKFTLYNLPAALCLVMSVVYDILDLERQVRAFDAFSSWESYCTLEKADPVELAAALGGSASAGRADAKIASAMRLRRGSFAENYFKRTNRKNPALRVLNYVIAPVIALSLVVFLMSLAAGRGFVPSANTFTVMVLIAMPVFTMAALIYPFCDVTRNLLKPTEVLLNEYEAETYAATDAVVFGEDEVFGARTLTIKRIGLCGGAMASDVFGMFDGAAAVFDKVGGVLAGAFRRAADSGVGGSGEADGGEVVIDRVSDGGIAALVGTKRYLIGNESFMTVNGVAAPVDRDDRAFAEDGGSAVMYVAVDGEVALKMYISYSADDEFRRLVTTLSERGIRPIMVSNDPNIDDALMARLLGELRCPVRVIRNSDAVIQKEDSDAEAGTKHTDGSVDAGLVADGSDWTALVGALPVCSKLCRVSALNMRICLGIIVGSVLLSTFLGALGILCGMHSAYVMLYQIVCVLPAIITSKLMLN